MQSVALTLKRAFWVMLLCFAIISFPLPSLAVTVQDIPNPRQVYGGWVTDMANLLDPETKATLNQKISKLEAENGTEITVVTVPEIAPSLTPKQFATELFNYWGIGKTGINNGILFLISKNDRRVEIRTGYGIEKILPNAQVGNIINQLIIPHFTSNDFAGGTRAGIQALIKALERHDILAITSKPQLNSQTWIGILGILGLIGVGIVLSFTQFFRANYKENKRIYQEINFSSWIDDLDWNGDGGSSWGGGDGGGFGGGDSGGGGDGGGW